jgi:hypothetical protein
MTARKTIIGLCSLCAMLFSAFAAQSAMAVSQTAVKCAAVGSGATFSDEHCIFAGSGSGFKHEAFTGKINAALTNFTTVGREPVFLESVVGGLNTILEAKKVEGTGTVENAEAGLFSEMYAEGLAETLTFSEVLVTNRSCFIFGITPGTGAKTLSTINTQPIRGTTKGQATGKIKFEPQTAGGKFAEFELTGAFCPEALKGLYPVFGTFISQKTEGATTPIAHNPITEAKSLRLKNAVTGPVAGLAGRVTINSSGTGLALT